LRAWLRGTIAGHPVTVYRRVGPGMTPTDRGICTKIKTRYVVSVHPNLPESEVPEVLIHELLHAADWTKDEEWVVEVAQDLARFLKEAGLLKP
jgi:hypothetical protein